MVNLFKLDMFPSINLYPAKIGVGFLAGFAAAFSCDIIPLLVTAAIFEVVDFVTGVMKSAVLARRSGGRFAFESIKAWRTIYKCVFIFIGICLAELLDRTLSPASRLRFANYFTAFVCGTEFWSFLENGSEVRQHPIFRIVRKLMNNKFKEATGEDLDQTIKDTKNQTNQHNEDRHQ